MSRGNRGGVVFVEDGERTLWLGKGGDCMADPKAYHGHQPLDRLQTLDGIAELRVHAREEGERSEEREAVKVEEEDSETGRVEVKCAFEFLKFTY